MKCAVQKYMVLGGFHVYKSVFLGWVVGRFNIAVNGEHNCGVPPIDNGQHRDWSDLCIMCWGWLSCLVPVASDSSLPTLDERKFGPLLHRSLYELR